MTSEERICWKMRGKYLRALLTFKIRQSDVVNFNLLRWAHRRDDAK